MIENKDINPFIEIRINNSYTSPDEFIQCIFILLESIYKTEKLSNFSNKPEGEFTYIFNEKNSFDLICQIDINDPEIINSFIFKYTIDIVDPITIDRLIQEYFLLKYHSDF
jgi:hypothetical protein